MKEINYDKTYHVNEDGTITDCFGNAMESKDEFAEEMDLLMGELRSAKRAIRGLEIQLASNTKSGDGL